VNTSPAVFGLLRAAVDELAAIGRSRGSQPILDAAQTFAERTRALRTEAYRLIDDVPPAESHAERLEVRAASLLLAHEATASLIAASGGGSIGFGSSPQRWVREALFMLVQAQTGPLRDELFAQWPLSRSGVAAEAPAPSA
jgi:hypothetical protein